jgi:hypothetical protein
MTSGLLFWTDRQSGAVGRIGEPLYCNNGFASLFDPTKSSLIYIAESGSSLVFQHVLSLTPGHKKKTVT